MHSFIKMGAENTQFQGKNFTFSHPRRGAPSQTLPKWSPIKQSPQPINNIFFINVNYAFFHQKWALKTHTFKAKMSNFLTLGGEPPLRPSPIYRQSTIATPFAQQKEMSIVHSFIKNGCWKHTFSRRKCQIFLPWEGNPLPDRPQFITNQQSPPFLHTSKIQDLCVISNGDENMNLET